MDRLVDDIILDVLYAAVQRKHKESGCACEVSFRKKVDLHWYPARCLVLNEFQDKAVSDFDRQVWGFEQKYGVTKVIAAKRSDLQRYITF